MYLAILGSLAEIGRELIASRTAEGRARSTKRMGRPFKLTPAQQAEALARKASCEPLTDIARSYNVSHMTIQASRHESGESVRLLRTYPELRLV